MYIYTDFCCRIVKISSLLSNKFSISTVGQHFFPLIEKDIKTQLMTLVENSITTYKIQSGLVVYQRISGWEGPEGSSDPTFLGKSLV